MIGSPSGWRRAVAFAVTLLFATQSAPTLAAPVTSRPQPRPTGQWQPTHSQATPIASETRRTRTLAAGATLLSESFTGNASTANGWLALGDACLTAGSSVTPITSIPACGSQAPVDAAGSGALQLTSGTTSQLGMVVERTALSTANGLQITFNDYAFNGSNPGADGLTFFLSDASKAIPSAAGDSGGSIGYANGNNTGTVVAGIANAYVGVALDEYGNFSSPTERRVGGPGQIPETIAVRGSASTNWAYLGGALNSSGVAASLPFALDTPAAKTRPAKRADDRRDAHTGRSPHRCDRSPRRQRPRLVLLPVDRWGNRRTGRSGKRLLRVHGIHGRLVQPPPN